MLLQWCKLVLTKSLHYGILSECVRNVTSISKIKCQSTKCKDSNDCTRLKLMALHKNLHTVKWVQELSRKIIAKAELQLIERI